MEKLRVKIFCVLLLSAGLASALTDKALMLVRDGFEARQTSLLNSQIGSPYPSTYDDVVGYVYNRQDFALAALYQNTQLSEANQALIDACNAILAEAPFDGEFGLHWVGNAFYRIYKLFYSSSEYFPGRLTSQAEDAICQVMWVWAKGQSRLQDANANLTDYDTWVYWGSENHDMMHKSTSYSAADILRNHSVYKNYTYDDGSSAAEQYEAWSSYFKEYIKQRAKKGIALELASTTYSKYTLQGYYNFYDFAPDTQLRQLAGNYLNLWWTDWALDQINSVRGGAKSRVYQDSASLASSDGAYNLAWFYLGVGSYCRFPSITCAVTSTYRLPLVVMDIALDTSSKGVYEYYSRRVGLVSFEEGSGDGGFTQDDLVGIDDSGGILRYTYHTPSYVLGSSMYEKRPYADWCGTSSQNRWLGAIFANNADARIYPECVGLKDDITTYNQYWAVQNKGTLIVQKLTTSRYSGDMRVYFSGSDTGMTITESGGWVFAQLPSAFAAVRPATGAYSWDDTNWIRISNEYAPVIMEVWQSSDFGNDFNTFKSAVLSQTIDINANGVLTYTGLKNAGVLTFYTNSNNLPKINGTTIDLNPYYVYNSPYLTQIWNKGVAYISKDNRSLRLPFDCDLVADLNYDCEVNFEDLAIMASSWMQCTTPGQENCIDAIK